MSRLRSLLDREAFNPSPFLGLLLNPFYFARRGLYWNVKNLSRRICGGALLDVGCGSKPYKHLFAVERYDGLEYVGDRLGRKEHAEYVYDGHRFPFRNAEYDHVLCNQVLEHVFNPDEFLQEIARVLKPNGELLLTVPFVWDEHEQPIDCARYTSFGLKELLSRHGLEVIEFRKSCADFSAIAQMSSTYFYKKCIGSGSAWRKITTGLICAVTNIIGAALAFVLPANEDLYLDNIVLARRRRDVEADGPSVYKAGSEGAKMSQADSSC